MRFFVLCIYNTLCMLGYRKASRTIDGDSLTIAMVDNLLMSVSYENTLALTYTIPSDRSITWDAMCIRYDEQYR